MTSKPVVFLLADLGITKSLSRPYVSNDNPYLEAQVSKPLNTGRSFQNGSGVPRTAGHSAITFSVGTILSITIPGLDSSRRKMSITDGLNKLSKNVRQF